MLQYENQGVRDLKNVRLESASLLKDLAEASFHTFCLANLLEGHWTTPAGAWRGLGEERQSTDGSRQIGPRTVGPWTVGPRTSGPQTVRPQGPVVRGPVVRGPTVRHEKVANWALDSWAPGPGCPGPNCLP